MYLIFLLQFTGKENVTSRVLPNRAAKNKKYEEVEISANTTQKKFEKVCPQSNQVVECLKC